MGIQSPFAGRVHHPPNSYTLTSATLKTLTFFKMTKFEFDVAMTCESCSEAITAILTKQQEEGAIDSFEVKLEDKKVFVTSSKLSGDEAAEVIKGAGKETTLVTSAE